MKGKIGKYKGIIFDLDGTLLDTIEDLGDSMNKLLTIDYADEILFLNIDMDYNLIWNSRIYKLRLRRYVDSNLSKEKLIVFKEGLTYPDFKRIIELIKKDSKNRDYEFLVTDRLKDYINKRELHILERSNIGLAIKNQSFEVTDKFQEYRTIVDSKMVRKLREKQVWDSFFMNTMRKATNFSVPGSGKTASVLGVYSYLNSKELVGKIIIVGPKNSFGSTKELNLFNIQDYRSLSDKKMLYYMRQKANIYYYLIMKV